MAHAQNKNNPSLNRGQRVVKQQRVIFGASYCISVTQQHSGRKGSLPPVTANIYMMPSHGWHYSQLFTLNPHSNCMWATVI